MPSLSPNKVPDAKRRKLGSADDFPNQSEFLAPLAKPAVEKLLIEEEDNVPKAEGNNAQAKLVAPDFKDVAAEEKVPILAPENPVNDSETKTADVVADNEAAKPNVKDVYPLPPEIENFLIQKEIPPSFVRRPSKSKPGQWTYAPLPSTGIKVVPTRHLRKAWFHHLEFETEKKRKADEEKRKVEEEKLRKKEEKAAAAAATKERLAGMTKEEKAAEKQKEKDAKAAGKVAKVAEKEAEKAAKIVAAQQKKEDAAKRKVGDKQGREFKKMVTDDIKASMVGVKRRGDYYVPGRTVGVAGI